MTPNKKQAFRDTIIQANFCSTYEKETPRIEAQKHLEDPQKTTNAAEK
jgi:hypothetical protein